MADETASGLPYPELPDANNPPADFRALAEAIDAIYGQAVANAGALPASGDFPGQRKFLTDTKEVAVWNGTTWEGYWKSFTPTWTNVTLGTTSLVNTGKYLILGKQATVKFNLVLGTGGAFTAGGTLLTLPVTMADTDLRAVGLAMMADGGAGASFRGALIRPSTSTTVAFTGLDVAGANLSPTVPWTWGPGDSLAGTVECEVAP